MRRLYVGAEAPTPTRRGWRDKFAATSARARGLARARHVVPLRGQNLGWGHDGGFAFAQALVKVVEGKGDQVPLRDQENEPESEERERPYIPGVPDENLKTHDRGDEREHAGNSQCQVQEEDQREPGLATLGELGAALQRFDRAEVFQNRYRQRGGAEESEGQTADGS